jgi:glutathione synthase/RimK-type ligase-like ATP-grasp enzyme
MERSLDINLVDAASRHRPSTEAANSRQGQDMNVKDPALAEASRSATARLNRNCFCITLDRAALRSALDHEAGDAGFYEAFNNSRPHLFSNVPVFLSKAVIEEMGGIVDAIEAATKLPGYRDAVLSWAPEIAQRDFGPAGALMGYDFHLGDDGPKLIEVNTNAGGAFLNAVLAKAQAACCAEVEQGLVGTRDDDFETRVIAMFTDEWRRQRGAGSPRRIAIVDDQPGEQYLYPEFVLAREMLLKHGIDAVIGDPSELHYEGGELRLDGQEIDLIYNRLVDFALDHPEHAALRAAYRAGAVVVTPNPHNHALFAAKRNLTLLSDPAALDGMGLSQEMRSRLAGVPRTVLVTPDNADALWQSRKDMFFKPLSGHGSKAVYRGDKVTKGVWAEIARGGYVAQAFAAPGQRMIEIDGAVAARKMDVRLYTYDGRILLTAARLYQGQTTNFRTPGGGFAPVLAI